MVVLVHFISKNLIPILFLCSVLVIAQEKDSVRTASVENIVISASKTSKKKKDSPILVQVLDSRSLENLQVCNLSEGLKFQPGLRVETDCQTCNYTQLRMNGLQGGYSQILINGRPLLSPLMGLYGLEQIPVNMIDRIEVIRGGGSSLYGTSAIGGTVNIITKLPKKNNIELNTYYQNINMKTDDLNINSNSTLMNKRKNTGISLFFSKRERGFYDANDDHFSELPKLENTSFGLNTFYQISENQKLEISISNLNEYRFGGEMIDKPAYLTQQSEERMHKIWMVSTDYQINFNEKKSSLIFYSAFQNTKRNHYTGVFPDNEQEIQEHLENPPYGTSNTTTMQTGFQINHDWRTHFDTRNIITLGSEFVTDKVNDNIPSYHYLIDQNTKNWGTFLQSDWDFAANFNLLSGFRIDQNNLLNKIMISPRIALLYKYNENTQLRLSYGTGFRAPQAFDTDLHIAFAGGGVSRVQIAPDLKQENSQSISTSINFDKASEKWIAGFTLEGFYTNLKNVFVLQPLGQDSFGQVFEKQNGQGATVKGITLELRTNFNKKIQLEAGFTLQKSEYENSVLYITGLDPTKTFLKTPSDYGFVNLNITPTKKWSTNINFVYTGRMKIAHFGGSENNKTDNFVATKDFYEVNTKLSYNIHLHHLKNDIELYGGIKNMLNHYQTDFDKGKNRDSNYIYGPSFPRTLYVGLKIKIDE